MDKSTHEIRLIHWKQIIEQCQNRPKGQTAKQWMTENQISEKSYYYWLRKVRNNAYSQLSSHTSLATVHERNSVTFAELPTYSQKNEEFSFTFQAAAVIKTAKATVALSDTISDRLLGRILQEVSNA